MKPDDNDLDTEAAKLNRLITKAIYERYGYERLARWNTSIPIEHRIVDFTLSVVCRGECEGYVMVLGMDNDHVELSFCFRELMLPDLAMLFDQMIAVIPKDGVLGNLEALESVFGNWENLVSWIRPFESRLFKASKRIVMAAANYCISNAEAFFDLGPEIKRNLIRFKSLSI